MGLSAASAVSLVLKSPLSELISGEAKHKKPAGEG